jgi:hypothetical protein
MVTSSDILQASQIRLYLLQRTSVQHLSDGGTRKALKCQPARGREADPDLGHG